MPLYETDYDISREREVASRLSDLWSVKLEKLPKLWPVDWAVVRKGEVTAFLEIKCRKYDYKFFAANGGYMVDVRKIVNLATLRRVTGNPCGIVVETSDGKLYHWNYRRSSSYDIRMGGRNDREDGVEACFMIPMHHFHPAQYIIPDASTRRSRSEASPETSHPATSRSGSSRHPTGSSPQPSWPHQELPQTGE